ncbi:hypothetical protein RFI_24451, partial [Reticulomyxa filosa]
EKECNSDDGQIEFDETDDMLSMQLGNLSQKWTKQDKASQKDTKQDVSPTAQVPATNGSNNENEGASAHQSTIDTQSNIKTEPTETKIDNNNNIGFFDYDFVSSQTDVLRLNSENTDESAQQKTMEQIVNEKTPIQEVRVSTGVNSDITTKSAFVNKNEIAYKKNLMLPKSAPAKVEEKQKKGFKMPRIIVPKSAVSSVPPPIVNSAVVNPPLNPPPVVRSFPNANENFTIQTKREDQSDSKHYKLQQFDKFLQGIIIVLLFLLWKLSIVLASFKDIFFWLG